MYTFFNGFSKYINKNIELSMGNYELANSTNDDIKRKIIYCN